MRILNMLAIFMLLAPLPLAAQASGSYEISSPTIDNGGSPANGANPSSSTYEVGIETLGETVAGGPAASASYEVLAGFVATQLDAPGGPGDAIFADDFESGNPSAWSVVAGG